MTKADLVEIVAERTGFTKTDVHVICDMLLDVIKEVMAEGHNIEIRRFGTFKLKIRKPRKARNPRTGESVPIPERVVPVFKPSNEFKEMIKITPDELRKLSQMK
ncbi:MAG: integration host factor subunit beta [Thermoprotei archaeon]|nr:MAG: integration host factor subunit beta [Thermoprotei archaeon]